MSGKKIAKFKELITEGTPKYQEKMKNQNTEYLNRKYVEKNHEKELMREEKFAKKEKKRSDKIIYKATKRSIFGRAFFAILFSIIAIALGLMAFGEFNFLNQNQIWFNLIAIILIAFSFAGIFSQNWFLLFYAGFGAFYILNNSYDLFQFTNIQMISLFIIINLIMFNFYIIFHKKYQVVQNDSFNKEENENDAIIVSSIVGETTRYIDSQKVKKVVVNARVSSTKVYFRNIEFIDNEMTVDVCADASSVKLYFPQEWIIESKIRGVLSEVKEEGGFKNDKESPKVTVIGHANVSEIYIYHI